ncbi:MAG: hypothetical protein RLZZ618_958 [Pseudomonadota bacterium]|jgi:thiamine biosynthesis lipoprotein
MRRVLVPSGIDGAGPALGGQLHAMRGLTMGTSWSVRLVGSRSLNLTLLQRHVQQTLDQVVAEMSTWLDTSDLSRFNRAPAGHAQVLPADCFEVLQTGQAVARASQGACDPTAGALVDLWGFGPTGRHDQPGFVPPTSADIEAARARCGWQLLRIDEATSTVWQPGGLRLDFSGIAKGFGVDQVARELSTQGVRDFLVEVGGELRGAGMKPDGQPWWVALEMPPGVQVQGQDPAEDNETLVALHGLSVATSGDYRRFFDWEAQRHSHTIDPRTGHPVQNRVASVTVLHAKCVLADAWSTALTVLGVDAGLALADERGLAVRFLQRADDGQVSEHLSRAFEGLAS